VPVEAADADIWDANGPEAPVNSEYLCNSRGCRPTKLDAQYSVAARLNQAAAQDCIGVG